MNEDPKDRRETFKIPTPFGLLEIKGRHTITSIIFAIVCVMAYMLWDHVRDVEARRAANMKEHMDIVHQNKKLEDRLVEMTYVLTLSPEERVKLRLDVPDGLRSRSQ